MATLVSGDTLSLNGLASATGQGTKSLSAANGDTTGPISLASFAIDSIGSITGFTYLVEATGDSYELTFDGAGTNFNNRIRTRAANFTWSVPTGSTISVASDDYISTVTAGTNIGGASQTIRSIYTNQTNTLRVVFNDGFNDHATNYNTAINKTVYAVDSYDGNSAALCLTMDSLITKADGTIVTAGDLEEGDILKGYNLQGLEHNSDSDYLFWSTNELGESSTDVTITNLTYSFTDKIFNINNGEITATLEHPMLVKNTEGSYSFKQMINIEIGDKLIKGTDSGIEEIEVTSVELIESTSSQEVISIDVESADTYLVNGYITHNKGSNSYVDPTPPAVTGLSYTDPLLSWNNDIDYEDYKVQIDNNSDFSSPTHDYSNWNSNSIEIGTDFFGLTQGTTYYARVAARDYGILGAYSSTLTFVL